MYECMYVWIYWRKNTNIEKIEKKIKKKRLFQNAARQQEQ